MNKIALIVYDSQYGNTEKIAKAIAKSMPSSKILRANEVNLDILEGVRLLVVGCPTQGGRATAAIERFLNQILKNRLIGVKVAVFDTRFLENNLSLPLKILVKTIGYAAPKMAKVLEDKGGKLISPPEGFIVTGKKGPLALGEIKRAEKWLRAVLRVG